MKKKTSGDGAFARKKGRRFGKGSGVRTRATSGLGVPVGDADGRDGG